MSDASHISHLSTPHNKLSQARLAAEAAFLAPRPRTDADDCPVIVVKRKKAVAVDGHDIRGDENEHSGESRAPKVFRVEHGPDPDASEAVNDPAEATGISDSHDEISVNLVAPLKRRRRVKRHGEVTIIRPQMPHGVGERVQATLTEEYAVTPAGRIFTDSLVEEIAALKRRAIADLAAVQSEIRKLEWQAEAARKTEAAQAVRWIRKAMAEYGLTSADLGL